MCFLDEFKAQNQNLVFTNSIYRRRHGNKYAPSDQISGLDLIPMLSFCELRSRDHHNTTFTNFFTPSTLLEGVLLSKSSASRKNNFGICPRMISEVEAVSNLEFEYKVVFTANPP